MSDLDDHPKAARHHPRTAAIIVNFGTAELAIAAADSLLAQPSGADLKVYIVDNPGPTKDAPWLRQAVARPERQGRVTLICNTENMGFGRANNVALDRLAAEPDPPEFVLMINPDAHVRSDALTKLTSVLGSGGAAAFAGPTLRLPGTGALRHAAFRFPHLGTVLQRAVNSRLFNAALPSWRLGRESGSATRRVDCVSGACVLTRFDAISELGGFDPRFFLYWEEVDLMHRAEKAGHYTLHVPGAEVFHAEGASTGLASHHGGRPKYPSCYYESWRLYFSKTHGRAYALLAATLWLAGASSQLMYSRFRRRTAHGIPVGVLSNIGRYVLLPLLGGTARQSGRSR